MPQLPPVLHHKENDPECPSCAAKLLLACPYMQSWYPLVKAAFPTIHIDYSYRDMILQNKLYQAGASRARWPFSKHNKTDPQGNPWSWALDLFEQIDGIGRWDIQKFIKINAWNLSGDYSVLWGYNLYGKYLSDGGHFEWDPNLKLDILHTEDVA